MPDRNAESHFNQVESTNIHRSMFNLMFRNIGTCNMASIIPFLCYLDGLPGDTFKTTTSAVFRMQTPLNATMDDLFVDTYYFAIPYRLVWKHFKEFMGENKDSAWVTQTEYEIPYLTAPSGGVTSGTNADYMGIPKGVNGITYSALPFRALTLIYNTWFRNQNLIAPYTEYDDDTNRTGSNTDPVLGGTPFKAGKIADFFTTSLPESQKALPGFTQTGVPIPLGTSAPIISERTGKKITFSTGESPNAPGYGTLGLSDGTNYTSITAQVGNHDNQETAKGGTSLGADWSTGGMLADLTNATAATINALRLYFQIQKLFELRARNGSRYFECIKTEFGVSPNLGYLQYPEYLGGKRTPLNLTQVVASSTTSSSESDTLGWTGGMSHTVFSNNDFTKSFQEHTIILGVFVIRQYHMYQQGLHRSWSRRKKLDFYTPLLAHLGEMPVYKREIFAMGTAQGSTDNAVFGYQERWAEYKYGNQLVTGEMNSTNPTPLDSWHYGDYYANAPTLSQDWFEETTEYLDRTIGVKSTLKNQFKFDIVTNIVATRPMPVYCTPGLIDHF